MTACEECGEHETGSASRAQCVFCEAGKQRFEGHAICSKCQDRHYTQGLGVLCKQCVDGEVRPSSDNPQRCEPCEFDKQLQGGKCEPYKRRKISFSDDENALVENTNHNTDSVIEDRYGKTQDEDDPVPANHYLHCEGGRCDKCESKTDDAAKRLCFHDVQECEPCAEGFTRSHCGDDTDVWVVFGSDVNGTTGLSFSVGHTVLLSVLNRQLDFSDTEVVWEDWLVEADLYIKQEGNCQQCKTCDEEQYNDGCALSKNYDEQTCRSCKVTDCGDGEWEFHPDPRGCSSISDDYLPTAPYSCVDCTAAIDNHLHIRCGGQSTLTRWHPRAERGEDGALLAVECDLEDLDNTDSAACRPGARYDECEACMHAGEPISAASVIPYCPPGWRINATDDDNSCDVNTLPEYNPACCVPCGVCEPEHPRAVGWERCPGNSSVDTQECRSNPSCAPGQYMQTTADGIQECTRCGLCAAGAR